jgi:diguanylate cyclase (GGDEF)-like protein
MWHSVVALRQVRRVCVNRDAQLAQVLAEFAHTLGTDFSIQSTLDHLVQRIVEAIPVTGAGVMVMGEGNELHFVSASNPIILEIEALQNELGEGPCLTAYQTGEPVSIPDLSRDDRFQRFSPRAFECGLGAVLTFPLRMDGDRLGALDLYRDVPGDLSDADMAVAKTLADVAAAYLVNARAREEAKERARRLHYLTQHDALTGLPNRSYLESLLEQALSAARSSGLGVAVLFVDLDGFKTINDRFGHHVGDQLLTAVASRLAGVIRDGDSLARLSGDEFVIVCGQLSSTDQGEAIARQIETALAEPIQLDEYVLHVTASVGVAFSQQDDSTPHRLLRDSDFAMYLAKRAGGAQFRVMSQSTFLGSSGDVMHSGLATALERGEFKLAYQPIVDVRDGTLHGVEALLRWKDPARGWVMPESIVPIAERTGMIEPLGAWALSQACRDLQQWWRDFGPKAVPHVAVNVSAHQVMGSAFPETVAHVLTESGIDPAALHLEVTESVFLVDAPRASAVLGELKELGVGLVLDDFGTGYSSLGYLKRFPFDVVKIDRGFIADMGADFATRAIVSAVINLSHALDLAVVAEGVETEAQLRQVIDLGADWAQGHYFSVALLPDELNVQILQHAADHPVRLPMKAGD